VRIGHLSDTHIDYSSGSNFTDGLNFRVKDGHDALTETIDQMIDQRVDLILHSGDLFHKSTPTVAGIVHVREQLLRLNKAHIPVLGITGNHDYPNTAFRKSATLAVNDPDRGIAFVDTPYTRVRFGDVAIHALSHGGLVPELVEPSPSSGDLNILLTHGAADIPGYSAFTCEDSPAEAWVPHHLLQSGWDYVLMGHYHRQHKLPLEDTVGWYAGSALRRGFSDEAGDRGWLLIDTTTGVVESHQIRQRPQVDLPVIDASSLTGDEVRDLITGNLAAIDVAGAILRQRVENCPAAVRKSMPTDPLPVETAASWQLRISRPTEAPRAVDGSTPAPVKPASLDEAWDGFVESDGSVLEDDRSIVAETGKGILSRVKGGGA
jgi:DNA repair exonuclease SbcCD nuclease subunit